MYLLSIFLFLFQGITFSQTISNSATDDDYWWVYQCGNTGSYKYAVPFTTPSGEDIEISQVQLKVHSANSNFNVYCRIETTSGFNPSNVVVTNGTSNSVSCSSTGWVTMTYSIGSRPILAPGTTYFLVVAGTSGSTATNTSFRFNNIFTAGSGGFDSRISNTSACGSETWSDGSYTYDDLMYIISYNSTCSSSTSFYSKSTGDLNSIDTWGVNTDGSGAKPCNFTSNNSIYNIRNRTSATISAAWTVSGTGSKVVLGNSSSPAITFTVPSSYAFTGTIDIDAASSGTNTLLLQNTTIPTFGTLNANSTVEYGSSSAQTISASNYGNLTSSSTGSRTLANSGTIGIAKTFTPGSNSYTISGSTIAYNGSNAQTIVAFNYNNLTSSSTGSRTLASSGTIGVAGTFTPGTNSYTITNSTLNFNSSSGQTIPAFNYFNLTSSSTGARTLASSGTIGIAGTFTKGTNTYTVTGSTVNFNSTNASQDIPAFTFNNLTINNSYGIVLTGAVNVGGTLSFTSGKITSTSTNLLAVTNTSSSAITGYSSSSYVSGPLQWSLTNGNSYFFPVGDASNYRPFEMNSISCSSPVVRVTMNGSGTSTYDATLTGIGARNWYAQLISGSYTSATIRITESGLTSNNVVASSAAQSGNYTNKGGNSIGATITSDAAISYTGSTYFAIGSVPSIVIADNGTQVSAANVYAGNTAVVLHKSQISPSGGNATLTGMTCTTTGTYAVSDITNLKVRYSTDASLDAGDATLSTITPATAGTQTFTSFTSQQTNDGLTGYIFITADIAAGAVLGRTIAVSALTTSNFTFSNGGKSGSTTGGGTQTISCQGLSGTYYVGSGQDYSTLYDAINALNTCGVSGPVTFLLTDETYTHNNSSNQLIINAVSGASSTNTITFKPNTGVTPEITINTTTTYDYSFQLNGADYIIFDGSNTTNGTTRDMKIIVASDDGDAFTLINSASNNTIKNIIIQGFANDNSYNAGVYVYGADNDNNTFQNNEIYNYYHGIYMEGNSSNYNDGNKIISNKIGSSNSSYYLGYFGILATYQNTIDISKNEIFGVWGSGSTKYGLYVSYSTNVTVSKNQVHDIVYTGTGGYGAIGMYFMLDASNPVVAIYNNFIYHIAADGWNTAENPYGISLNGSFTSGVVVYFNSIYLTQDAAYGLNYSNSVFSAGVFVNSGVSGINFRNNIIRNSLGLRSGSSLTTYKGYAIYYAGGSTDPFGTINRNLYYVTNHSTNTVGYGNYADILTIADWRTYTSAEANSTYADPTFVSTSDLHIQTTFYTGVAITGYDDDIDGEPRIVPHRGADEQTAVSSPTITGVTPNTLYYDKGKTLTITGTQLNSVTTVTYGGVSASITSATATELVVTVPPGNYTSNDLVVTNPAGSATNTGVARQSRTTIPVKSSGAGVDDHTTIASALNGLYAWKGATAFDASYTIDVYNGTYAEMVSPNTALNPTSSNKLIIQNSSGNAPVINATGLNNGFNIDAINFVKISGFTVYGATNDNIYVKGSSPEICYNKTYSSTGASGIKLDGCTSANVHHNLSYNNNKYGIHNLSSNSTTIKNNTVYGNGSSSLAQTSTTYTWTGSTAIADNSTTNQNLTGVGSHTIAKIEVINLNITHTFDGDLDIYLIGPDATQVELSTDNGSSYDNYANTNFADDASTSITAGSAPFTGTFIPEGSLAAFNGKNSSGTWTLRITDDASSDVGTLTSFSLKIYYNTSGTSTGSGLFVESGTSVEVTNNILVANYSTTDAYSCLQTGAAVSIATSSGYNTYYPNGNISMIKHNGTTYSDISTWNGTNYGNEDLDSDPKFVNAGTDFHLKSEALDGTYTGGSWPPLSAAGGAWTQYLGNHSPSIDRGKTGDTYTTEPTSNGSRINQGCYGNTVQASKSACEAADDPVCTAASNVACTSFQANWSASTNATGYKIDVSTNAGFTSFVGSFNALDVGNVLLYNITGLTNGATYYYRIRAYNACGVTTGVSAPITATTLAPPATPVATAVTTVGCNDFYANWDASSGASNYNLDVNTASNFAGTTILNNQVTGNVTTYQVTGLSASSTYYYRISATNSCGTSAESNTITASTQSAPDIPTINPASAPVCGGFTASWSAAAGATSYNLQISTVIDFSSYVTAGGTTYNNAYSTASTSRNVTGLSNNTTYYFRVRSLATCANSAYSDVMTYTTIPALSTPTALSATNNECTSFTANWEALAGATKYYLDVDNTSDCSSPLAGYSNLDVGNVTNYNITGLNTGATYYYRIRAYNACGTSASSSIIATATLSATTAPTAIAASSVGTNQFTANWSSVPYADTYYLDVATNSGFTAFVSGFNNLNVGNTTTYPVTGLNATTTYYYRVRASHCGTSGNSNTITVATLTPDMGLYVAGDLINNGTIDQTNDAGYINLTGINNIIGVTNTSSNSGTFNTVKLAIKGNLSYDGVMSNTVTETKIEATKQLTINSNRTYKNVLMTNIGTLSLAANSTVENSGDWINTGAFTADANSMVKFNGASQQTIATGTSSSQQFGRVTFNNSGNNAAWDIKTNRMEIQNSASFLNGIITYNNTSLDTLVFLDNSQVEGTIATTSFVDGVIQKRGDDAFVFATGNVSGIKKVSAPIGISASAYSVFTAKYAFSAPSNTASSYILDTPYPMTTVSTLEWWDLSKVSGSGTPAVTLYWYDGGRSGIGTGTSPLASDYQDLTVAHWNGTKWESKCSSPTATGSNASGTVVSNVAFTSYSPISFGSKTGKNPLPVSLTDFYGICNEKGISLHWSTASEINCDYFAVEKSVDGKNWMYLGKAECEMNSNEARNYIYYDAEINEDAFYRLTQFDIDGKQRLEKTIYVNCGHSESVVAYCSIYPNPASDMLTVEIGSQKEQDITFVLNDPVGKKIKEFNYHLLPGFNKLQLILPDLADGVYYLKHPFINDIPKVHKIVIRKN